LVRRSDRRTRFVLLAAAPRDSRAVFTLLMVVGTLAACCAPRPVSGYLTPVATSASGATEHTLFVATTRQRNSPPAIVASSLAAGLRTGCFLTT
jgi:hypothetical protein